MTELIRCEGITKTYRIGKTEIPVLRGVDLSVAAGETVAITGESGSGKSTLLYILGLLDEPTAGEIYYQNEALLQQPRSVRRTYQSRSVGFVFQSFHLIPELDVLDNITMADRPERLFARKGADAADKALGLADRMGLGERVDHRPMELSGGEQQRVAIARALMNDPTLILADEPTGNLDEQTGHGILSALFDQVRERDASLIMVTHNPAIAALCDRRLKLVQGRLADQ